MAPVTFAHAGSRARPRKAAWLLAACALGYTWQSSEPLVRPDPREVVVAAAARHGVRVTKARVFWLAPPPSGLGDWLRAILRSPGRLLREPHAVFEGAGDDELSDIYLASVQVSPDGAALGATLTNLSRTSGAAESDLVVFKSSAAWLVRSEEGVLGARVAHFSPWPDAESDTPAEWSAPERWQARLQNLQEFGYLGSLRLDELSVSPAAVRAELSLKDTPDGDTFPVVVADGVRWDGTEPSSGGFTWLPDVPGRPPPLLPWAAERLRETWLGEQGVALLKAVGFAGLDLAERAVQKVLPSDGAAEVEKELGPLLTRAATEDTDDASGFPPPPLTPVSKAPLDGEGAWLSLDDDPFVARDAEGRAPFVFSFVRPDPARPYAQAYVVLWDPRRVELHAVGGTGEPRSKTGERGSGRIPRDARTLRRLVGAFNGAFRTRHGEFGMAASGTLYLPPRPYAATVATQEDGSTAFGTWPDSSALPDGLTMFRQNLSPLVQHGDINPYKRHYWGGLPEGWTEESLTVRTALCLTREGFVAYVYGTSLSPAALMRAAEAARCDYALHLDMNAGNTGFEFYRAGPAGSLGPLGRPLDTAWETRGTLSLPQHGGEPPFDFVARRLTRRMPIMNFPRYIQRETRDFFFLTLRPQAGDLPLPEHWQPSGAHNGWTLEGPSPAAIARATVAPFSESPEARVHLTTLDPRHFVAEEPSAVDRADEAFVHFSFAGSRSPSDAAPCVWWTPRAFVVSREAPSPRALCLGRPHSEKVHEERAAALLAVTDEGHLLYAEARGTPHDAARWLTLAETLGLSAPLLLQERVDVRFGARGSSATARVALRRTAGPGGRLLFPDTPVVPPRVWALRQIAPVAVTPQPHGMPSIYRD